MFISGNLAVNWALGIRFTQKMQRKSDRDIVSGLEAHLGTEACASIYLGTSLLSSRGFCDFVGRSLKNSPGRGSMASVAPWHQQEVDSSTLQEPKSKDMQVPYIKWHSI